jgi:hypothetical protein
MKCAMVEVNEIASVLVAAAVIDRVRPHCDDASAAMVADRGCARVRTPAAHASHRARRK